MFIGDLHLNATGRNIRELTATLAPAAAGLHRAIEQELQCQIALRKAAVVGSTPEEQQQVQKCLGRYAGKCGRGSAANLGIDYSAGQLRKLRTPSQTMIARIKKFDKRKGRLRAVSKAGASMQTLWNTGLVLEAHFRRQEDGRMMVG